MAMPTTGPSTVSGDRAGSNAQDPEWALLVDMVASTEPETGPLGHAYSLGFGRTHGDPLTLTELREDLQSNVKVRGKKLELLVATPAH
jgi:hypothetical protein